jgi:glycogen operon protein
LAGSADAFAHGQRAAYSSVNFVTAHDGFNLMDVVSYCERRNQANGEHNRDGHGHNLSVNHGVEGASDLPAVQEARARHRRTLLAATVLSLGTPMLLAGDELGHTQGGNNNAYCQDNATTWLRWDAFAQHETAFWARAIALRRQLPALQASGWWRSSAESAGRGPVATWALPDGRPLQPADWDAPHGGAMAVALQAGTPDAVLLLLNPSSHEQVFCLPQGAWRVVLDSARPELPSEGVPVVSNVITLQADSLMLLT